MAKYRYEGYNQHEPDDVTAGHLIAYLGLHDIMVCMLKNELGLEVRDGKGARPLY